MLFALIKKYKVLIIILTLCVHESKLFSMNRLLTMVQTSSATPLIIDFFLPFCVTGSIRTQLKLGYDYKIYQDIYGKFCAVEPVTLKKLLDKEKNRDIMEIYKIIFFSDVVILLSYFYFKNKIHAIFKFNMKYEKQGYLSALIPMIFVYLPLVIGKKIF